jgi:hypothetical protein
MNVLRPAILALALVLPLSGGLAACGGGGAKIDARTTTLGQELKDLDAAYQQGLLTEKEYKQKRQEIMKRY